MLLNREKHHKKPWIIFIFYSILLLKAPFRISDIIEVMEILSSKYAEVHPLFAYHIVVNRQTNKLKNQLRHFFYTFVYNTVTICKFDN